MTLMCSMPLDYQQINQQHDIDFEKYFAPELTRLLPYSEAGLMTSSNNGITITPKGRLFVRAIGMVFDKYMGQPTVSTYSKLI